MEWVSSVGEFSTTRVVFRVDDFARFGFMIKMTSCIYLGGFFFFLNKRQKRENETIVKELSAYQL